MKSLVLGIGAAGNKAAMELVNRGVIEKNDVILVNSTDKDFPKDAEVNTLILNPGKSGCGKERSLAKEYTIAAINAGKFNFELDDSYQAVIIVTSLEGGTGSGSTPLIAQYCDQVLGLNVHVFGFCGFEEDPRGLLNTINFFKDLDSELVVHTIQNKKFLPQAKNNKFRAEELANKEFAKEVEILLGENLEDSTQNIDDTDIYKVANTTGYMIIDKIELTSSLDSLEDFDKSCRQLIQNTASIKPSEPSAARMGVILNLSEHSEDAVDFTYVSLKEAYGFPYETFTHKQYDGGTEYIAIIVGGMMMPLDEVKAIYERYTEESSKVNKGSDNFFASIGALDTDTTEFDLGGNRKSKKSTADFMKQFETKAVIKPSIDNNVTVKKKGGSN